MWNTSKRVILQFFFLFGLIFPQSVNAQVILGNWNLTTPLISQVASHVSEFVDGKLFVVGGATSITIPLRLVSSPDTFGTIPSWINFSAQLPKDLFWHNSAKNGDDVYVIGGSTLNPLLKSQNVYLGNVVSGDITTWTELQPLPVSLALGGAVVAGDYLYYGGGVNNSNQVSDKIYAAKILSDGSLEPWFIAGQFPIGTAGVTLLERSGSIYSIGGYAQTTKVYRFQIYGDGSLTPPVAQPDLIMDFERGVAVRIGNQIFAFAGTTLATADIDGAGGVGAWSNTGVTIPVGNWCCGTMNASDNFLYILGGFNRPSSYLSSVVYAPISGTPEPTPTFSLLPTVTPTIFPSPTPTTSPDPIIFVPGMGASWNYEAIMHNQTVPNENWTLNPFVKDYENLLESLEAYPLHVYNYDWRKNISANVADFENYLNELGSNKYDVIGHSMGGLIARGAAISNPNLFDKLIIAGSPHSGSASIYKLWEGADFSVLNMRERIALELYVNTSRRLFDTSVSTIQSLIPSLKDILPTYDFLKNSSGVYKSVSSMVEKNNFLPLGEYTNEKTIYSSDYDTLSEHTYVSRDAIDTLLGRWVDGKPTSNIFAEGDDTVTVLSSRVNGNTYFESQNRHSGLLDGENINEVLSTLGISDSFSGDSETLHDTAMVISIASPATFSVLGPNGQSYLPQENLLVIYNPEGGDYKVKLTSTAPGNYSLMIGKLTGSDSSWQEIPGTFTTSGKQVEYVTHFSTSTPDLGTDPLVDASKKLDELFSKVIKSNLKPAKRGIFIADIRYMKSLVKTLENSRNKPRYKKIATLLLKTIQVSIKAFPTFAPDLRLIQDNIEEELQNNI